MVADVEKIQYGVTRTFLKGGKMIISGGQYALIMTTTTEKVEELITFVGAHAADPNFDLVVTTPATGNVRYIEWVKAMCVTRASEITREAANQKELRDKLTARSTLKHT